MTISAAFTFSGESVPLAKKSVAAATVFTATIDDLSGIASVEWAIIGTDGATAIGDYTVATSGPKGSIYTITSLTQFTGGILQATVRNGDYVDVKRALFYVPSAVAGLEPLMFNEWFEGNSAAAYVAKMNAATLTFDAASGFDPQATPVQNITTAGAAGITNVATRAGEALNAGPTGEARLVLQAGTSSLACEDFEIACDSWSLTSVTTHAVTAPVSTIAAVTSHTVTSPAVSHVCTTFGITATGACTLNGEPLNGYRSVDLIIKTQTTLTGAQTLDGVGVGGAVTQYSILFTGQTDPLENGVYIAPIGGGAYTRRADFNALAKYVVGTSFRAQLGTANKGDLYTLESLTSSLPAVWRDDTGGGGGASITNAGGTVAVDGVGNITATVGVGDDFIVDQNGIQVFANDGGTGVTKVDSDGAAVQIGPGASDVALGGAGLTSITRTIGSSVVTETVSGANRSVVTTDAAGALACTSLYDDAACSHTYVGTLTETAPTVIIAAATELQFDTALLDSNATTVDFDGTTFTGDYTNVTWTVGNAWAANATGAAQLLSFSSSVVIASGAVAPSVQSPIGLDLARWGVGVERILLRIPADVGTAVTSRAVLATIPIPTGPMRRIRGTVKGWPAAGAGQATTVDLHAENVAGTVTIFGSTIADVAGTAALGTVDAAVSTTNVTIGVTPGAATAYTWHFNDLGDL